MKFLADYAEVAYLLISALLFLLGGAATVIVKMKLAIVDGKNKLQDLKIINHEKRIAELEGKKIATEKDINFLSRDLERWGNEIKASLAEHKGEIREVKGLIKMRMTA